MISNSTTLVENAQLEIKKDSGGQQNSMAPSNSFFHSQIDFLRLFFIGKFESSSLLDDIKRSKAKADSTGDDASYFFESGNRALVKSRQHWGKGNNYLDTVFKYRGIEVGICTKTEKEGQKSIEIVFRGSMCTEMGLPACRAIVEDLLIDLEFKSESEKVGEVHFACDVKIPFGEFAKLILADHVVTRNKDDGFRRENRKMCSYYSGKRHKKYLRIYNKNLELAKEPEKFENYLRYISDGEVFDDLTRLEFEIGREGFVKHGIDTWEDLCASAGEFMEYLTLDFFRITEKKMSLNNTAKNDKRVHSVWQAARDGFKALGESLRNKGKSVFRKARSNHESDPSMSVAMNMVTGCLSGLLARMRVVPTESRVLKLVSSNIREIQRKTTEKFLQMHGQSFGEFYGDDRLSKEFLDKRQMEFARI